MVNGCVKYEQNPLNIAGCWVVTRTEGAGHDNTLWPEKAESKKETRWVDSTRTTEVTPVTIW